MVIICGGTLKMSNNIITPTLLFIYDLLTITSDEKTFLHMRVLVYRWPIIIWTKIHDRKSSYTNEWVVENNQTLMVRLQLVVMHDQLIFRWWMSSVDVCLLRNIPLLYAQCDFPSNGFLSQCFSRWYTIRPDLRIDDPKTCWS